MASKKSFFQVNWLQDPQFAQWLEKSSDLNSAKCNLCKKTFSLSNMGRRAVTSHMRSTKNTQNETSASTTVSIRAFIKPSSVSSSETNCTQIHDNNNQSESTNLNCETSTHPPTLQPILPVQNSQSQLVRSNEPRGLKALLLRDDVTKAEILWCLQAVMTHKSMRSAGKDVQLMALMFPDSDIAKKMQLQKDKIGYTLAYGITPFFLNELVKNLSDSEFISVGFDESLNKVSQKNQMDVNVRYWDNAMNEVKCHYLTSVFLGRSTAQDLLIAYNEAIKPLDKTKIVQISMDGPNVNKKFLKDLKESMMDEPHERKLLEIGSCGIHTMHCAFKAAMIATGWNLVGFLRSLYNLLKDCPARRAIYTAVSKSELFPLKFCTVRWLENSNVAERAIQILPSVDLFLKEMKRTGQASSSQSYKTVSEFLDDPFLHAKLEFFKSLASDLEPFLREFQSDQPLSPFLYNSLSSTIRTEMDKVVLASVMGENTVVKDIKMSEGNLKNAKNITLGIGVKSALRAMHKQSDLKILCFRQECRLALVTFVNRMLEKSPITYQFTKYVSCFSPKVALEKKISKIRMENLLTLLLESNWINTIEGDQAQRTFATLTQDEDVVVELKKFNRNDERIDHFWTRILKSHPENSSSFNKVMKLVTTLSHGNASIERGFSVNKECIVENMHEELLIAQRTIYDHITTGGGISKINITKQLTNAARNSYSRFQEALKKKKIEIEECAARKLKKRVAEKELKELEAKRAKLLKDAHERADLISEEISRMKKLA